MKAPALLLCATSLTAATLSLAAASQPLALPVAPEGIEIKLVASEPLLRNPCALAFDSRGRLFVGQGPQYRNPKPDTPGDTIELLIDSDGDGIYDRTKTFARGLNCVQGMAWRGRDLYIANSPDLTIVRDLDGDDEADEYVLLYTDVGNIEHALHGLNFAPDGRLYMSKGNSKGLNQPGRTAPHVFLELHGQTPLAGAPAIPPARVFTKETYRATYQDPEDDWGRCGGVLRCDPDGSNLEIVSRGFRNPWDIAFDAEFNWLGTDNDQSDGDRIFMPFMGADFGWSHSWSPDWTGRNHLPTVPISGPIFNGSGTGIVYFDTPALPASFRGVWFINDFLHRTTYAYRPAWDGALIQPEGGKWQPFVRAGNALFNPVDLEVGPDGALYMTGWGSALGATFVDGRQTNEGRLWRIATRGFVSGTVGAHRHRPHASWTFAELVDDLAGPVAAYRTDAADELVRRGDSIRHELLTFASRTDLPVGQQTWALWTLGRIATPDPALDQWFAVSAAPISRNAHQQALGIVANRLRDSDRSSLPPQWIADSTRHPEPRVRFSAFQAIAHTRHAGLLPPLKAALESENDRISYYAAWQAMAALSSPEQLRESLRDPRGGVRRAALLAVLDQGLLSEPEVRSMLQDSDGPVAELAGLWLAKRDGNPLIDISPAPGDFVGNVRLKIIPGIKPGVVRFTTDGSEPVYSPGPEGARITLSETTTVKAALFVDGRKVGTTSTGVYRRITPPPPPPAISLEPPAAPLTIPAVIAALSAADVSRGRAVFHAAGCIACHRAGNEGAAFGPDLSELAARGNIERIVRSILTPSAEIVEGFALHAYSLSGGRTVVGRVLEESQLAFSVIQPDNEVVTVMRRDVVKDEPMPASAMPAYDQAMSVNDLAALVAWLARP